ncbi:MAG TPA: hypothetical protein VJR58_25825 [Vineibacter sp.]|nr:hypothetical protein [Vineibacter sp.]
MVWSRVIGAFFIGLGVLSLSLAVVRGMDRLTCLATDPVGTAIIDSVP